MLLVKRLDLLVIQHSRDDAAVPIHPLLSSLDTADGEICLK
jgi:hypothetical protein